MKLDRHHLWIAIVAATASAAFTQPASAQAKPASPILIHAEDNEAVTVDSSGGKQYRMAPMPLKIDGSLQRVGPNRTPPVITSVVFMFETQDGLIECSNRWRDLCRPHTYGTGVRLERTWVVLRRGLWYECHGPERDAKCIATVAFNGPRGNTSEVVRWLTPPTR
jgi:hypothetical protein